MVETAQNTITGPIEIVDQPEETLEDKGVNVWLLIPVMLAIAVGIFFVVSRALDKEE